MIYRYVYGSMLETDTILNKPQPAQGDLPRFAMDAEAMTFTMTMAPEDRVYGLGENVRGINKRGWVYESRTADDPIHSEEKHSLYACHNFIVLEGKERFGLYVDYPGIATFDIGYTDINVLQIRLSDMNADIYYITGDSAVDIVHQFRELIGKSYIAPKWAFGYGQSRWGYKCEEDFREVVRNYEEADMPLDALYMDIDYMERYKDFTVNKERFPDFPAFVQEMKDKGIHLVPIIDAAVKQEEGYSVYEEGLKNGYFCTKEDGSPFVAAVWPGLSLFPDTLNPKAREWFGNNYKVLMDQGIEGFWNDMNEPSIFYTEDRLRETLEKLDEYRGRRLNLTEYWEMMGLVNGMEQSTEDYKKFYHNMNGTTRVRHDHVHNLYGYNMTRAAGEAFYRMEPDKRVLIFSRASNIGMHRYGGVWQGDNRAWWSHLLMNLKMLPSLNMCGFLYTGADTTGFGSDTTEDLCMRWLELSMFTPLMRNHSAQYTRKRELYRFTDKDGFRHILNMRYRLLPYIYSEYMKASVFGTMMFRPLAFDYPNDDRAVRIEDQLMLGDGMMIAPVHEQNAVGRMVYLPESMKLYRFRKDGTVDEEILSAGDHYVPCALSDVILFVRPNHIIPLSSGGKRVADVDFENLTFLSYPCGEASVYEYYSDDGYTRDYDAEKHITKITLDKEGNILR